MHRLSRQLKNRDAYTPAAASSRTTVHHMVEATRQSTVTTHCSVCLQNTTQLVIGKSEGGSRRTYQSHSCACIAGGVAKGKKRR